MRIYSMTATFGKLEQETLTLQPGLNVISAGNEWGKSTWCAFLAAMLYGLDTRAKSTKTNLADKERYAPWSGNPMSGRIDLCWQGRNITIERRTRGRTPLGEFRAYETESGLELPELNGKNCGEMLLGVERSVFLRSGFIRFQDLQVHDDEALRRRLNSLVTTGEENSAADQLAGELKSLKNRIRHNRTGLLPQAEEERSRLEGQYRRLKALESQNAQLLRQLDANADWRMALENHLNALAYAESQDAARRIRQAEATLGEAKARLEAAEEKCAALPDRDTARNALTARRAEPTKKTNLLLLVGAVLAILGLILLFLRRIPGLICCGAGAVVLLWGLLRKLGHAAEAREEQPRTYWEAVLTAWEDLDTARAAVREAECRCQDLKALARPAPPPAFPDRMTDTEEQTLVLLEECTRERARLENSQGRCRGAMEAIGDGEELARALTRLDTRIRELEEKYLALTIAQETLAEARQELQRRFAPRIAKRAGELMDTMTEGRYDRLRIGENLSLQAGAREETTLHDALWRSDGTVDQLYLSLRLAVAEELLPEGPLVLDDALIRFDDDRLKAAMEILKDEGKTRQVILFSCHDRESKML